VPLATTNGPPPVVLLAVGGFISVLGIRGLWQLRRSPGASRSTAVQGMKAFLALFVLAAVLATSVGAADLLPSTETRRVVPSRIYTNSDTRGDEYFWVTDSHGTKYLSSPSVFTRIRIGSAYSCRVHVYAALIQPTLLSCSRG
jgi:hypothetical protein